jgi:hypothetical protein
MLSCAGLLSLAGCHVSPADRINAALPPGPEVALARDALFTGARTQKVDAAALVAELRERMERRALDCAKGYTPGVFDGNDQIREKLTDRACFAKADVALRDWLLERYTAMFGGPAMALRDPRPARVADAPRVDVEREAATVAPLAPSPDNDPMIGVNAVPSDPRPEAAKPTADIGPTRRELIERTIRENDVSPEMAEHMRKWADDVDRKSQPSAPPPKPVQTLTPTTSALPADQTLAGQIDVAPDARVLAVGIYEAADGEHSFRGPRKAGTVQVFVMKSEHPIVLVLSSYEPVTWSVQLQNGAKVSHVLLSGYHASQVYGVPGAHIESIGTQHAYRRGSPEFQTLDGLVRQFTGKRIGSFQGAYSGTSFSLNP